MDRLLLVGALGGETLPLLAALERPRPLSRRLVAGRLAGREVAVLTCGVGPRKAAARARAAIGLWRPDAAVSLGTCGALIDDLPVGSVVTANALFSDDGPGPDPLPWPGARAVAVVTVSRPVWTIDRRAVLAAAGAAVCEMEAAAVQRALAPLPVLALKVVSDLAGASPEDPPDRPGPLALARFQVRAGALVARYLLPALQLGLGKR